MGDSSTLPWSQDHQIRIIALITPADAAESTALDAALEARCRSLTPHVDSGLPHERAALSGGSSVAWYSVDAAPTSGPLPARLYVIVSGGEDGLDSAETELDELHDLVHDAAPRAVITDAQQWSLGDEEWFSAPTRVGQAEG